MQLTEFTQDAEIFIDANIFTYFALRNPIYQAACTTFLARVEADEIQAATSVFSLNEAFYTMLIGKGSELLNSTKIKQIKVKLAQDATFSTTCYNACLEFSRYVTILRATGLRLVEIDYADALHVATCQHYDIAHIATADSHFGQVDLLNVWKPEAAK